MRRNLWHNVSLKLLKYLVKVINKKLGQVSENEQKKIKFQPKFYIQLVFKAPLCITLTISDQNHYLNREW